MRLRRLWSSRRDAAGLALYWSGLARAFEVAERPAGAIILMYHSVAEAEAARQIDPPNRVAPGLFLRQMEFLRQHRRVVPLSQVVEQIERGVSAPAGTVCITFDDGYLDNLTVAAPILEANELPATLFLATGYVARAQSQWADTLHRVLTHRTRDRLSMSSIGLDETNLADPAPRQAARRLLHRRLLECGHAERTRVLEELEDRLSPAGKPARLTMDWDEARTLRRRYPLLDFGGHTRDHIDLSAHRGEAARAQIAGCAEDLRRELEIEPAHFSFPYSRWCPETREMVVAGGWRSALGMSEGLRICAASDRFSMPRVESPRSMSELRFKTSGAYPGVLSVLGLG